MITAHYTPNKIINLRFGKTIPELSLMNLCSQKIVLKQLCNSSLIQYKCYSINVTTDTFPSNKYVLERLKYYSLQS